VEVKLRILIPLFFTFLSVLPVHAQDDDLLINLDRDFGYALGSEIQGVFTIHVSGPQGLERVVFLIDSRTLGEDDEPPFQLQFDTGSFELGNHTLNVVGYTNDGRELNSQLILVEFVSPDRGWQTALRILLPVAGVTLVAVLLSALFPFLFGRPKGKDLPLGTPRSYGLLGGTICPKCSRPFGMHVYGLNLVAGKWDRCPYCARWSLVRRVSSAELAAAEAAELVLSAEESPVSTLSEEEKLRKSLEDSRFQDS
jgi:hypothetical protein